MLEDEQLGGAQPPRPSAARLQLEMSAVDVDGLFTLVGHLLDTLDTEGATTIEEREDKREAEDANARLSRLGGDTALYQRLAACGFAGTEYQQFRGELSAYAIPVLRSFIRRKMIYVMCQQAGRPVSATDTVREHLARHVDDRLELALETVAQGLRLFERYALIGGRWTPERGASLKTYFIGACVRSFSTVFRRWIAEHEHPDAHALRLDAALAQGVEPRGDRDPADDVVGMQRVQDYLDGMKPAAREAAARVALLAETQAEAAQALNTTERAVEGHFYRHRRETQRRAEGKHSTRKRGEA